MIPNGMIYGHSKTDVSVVIPKEMFPLLSQKGMFPLSSQKGSFHCHLERDHSNVIPKGMFPLSSQKGSFQCHPKRDFSIVIQKGTLAIWSYSILLTLSLQIRCTTSTLTSGTITFSVGTSTPSWHWSTWILKMQQRHYRNRSVLKVILSFTYIFAYGLLFIYLFS